MSPSRCIAATACTAVVALATVAVIADTDADTDTDGDTVARSTPAATTAPPAATDAVAPQRAPSTDPPADATVASVTTAPPTPPAVATSTRRADAGRASLDGAWSTQGARIVDGDGDEVVIRGVNWFGFETAAGVPHGLWSRNMEEMLDQIAELGFNTIRVPFASAIIDASDPVQGVDPTTNPDLAGSTSLEVLDRFVDAAGARGLGIILDRHTLAPDNRHHLWYDEQFPPERLVSDWEFLAERYRDVPSVIGADLYNEPHDEACWACGDPAVDWAAAATEAADALHRIEPDWLVFVEGVERADGGSCDGPEAGDACTWWGGDLHRAAESPIELEVADRVVYSPHEYATSVHRQRWFDDPAFPTNMPSIWDRFWGHLELTDAAPVMVGEFGTTLDADVDGIWLGALLEYLDRVGAGFTFWTFNPNSGDTGGILRDDWVTVDQTKMAYLEPYLVGPFPPVGVADG